MSKLPEDHDSKVNAVLHLIWMSAVTSFDPNFMSWYRMVVDKVTDGADRMGVDIQFRDKIVEMRQQGKITTDVQIMRARAEQIANDEPVENWFELAKKYGDSLLVR